MRRLVEVLLCILLTAGCANQPPNLEKVWELSGFSDPESVVYDKVEDIYFVSNVDGNPAIKDGNGFISKVSDNKIIKKKWITGLNSPNGMAIYNRLLYVADIDTLIVIDLKTERIHAQYKAIGSRHLNDVAVDRNGDVYVSDSDLHANTIWKLSGKTFSIWFQSDKLNLPNGLYAADTVLYVVNSGRPGNIKAISYAEKEMTTFGPKEFKVNLDGLDGIEMDTKGNFFVSDWMNGGIYYVSSSKAVKLLTLDCGCADIEYVEEKKLLLVPMMNHGKLIAYTHK
jgi:hypothetical protein